MRDDGGAGEHRRRRPLGSQRRRTLRRTGAGVAETATRNGREPIRSHRPASYG